VQEPPDQSKPEPDDAIHRRQGTMKMATLAFQNLNIQAERRAGIKDSISEALLPISYVLLIVAVCMSAHPMVKALTFTLPLAAFCYYIYRRVGVIATFDNRQAFLTWRLLIATFLFGGTFALWAVYTLAYIGKLAMHQI
jgi:hypothetical protein